MLHPIRCVARTHGVVIGEVVSGRQRRRYALPYGWKSIRRRILARDGHRCMHILQTDMALTHAGVLVADTTRSDVMLVIAYAGDRCPERATDVDHIRTAMRVSLAYMVEHDIAWKWIVDDNGLQIDSLAMMRQRHAENAGNVVVIEDHRDVNLQSLCSWHHDIKTSSESAMGVGGIGHGGRKHPGMV